MLSKLIDEGYSAQDIGSILGQHPVAVRRKLPQGYKPTKKLEIPYGLTSQSDGLRATLGGIIASMSEKGLTRDEIGGITGLNKRESHRAERRPFAHDWTLSQIERTLAYEFTGKACIGILDPHAEDEG